jgi:hypothetical protein
MQGMGVMHEWLEDQKRRGAFQGPVYGPIGLEITVPDAVTNARPIEAVGDVSMEGVQAT